MHHHHHYVDEYESTPQQTDDKHPRTASYGGVRSSSAKRPEGEPHGGWVQEKRVDESKFQQLVCQVPQSNSPTTKQLVLQTYHNSQKKKVESSSTTPKPLDANLQL